MNRHDFQPPDAPFQALRKYVRPARQTPPAELEHCDLCGEPILPEHRHLLEIVPRQLVCACRACSILFDREAASEGRYRLIPERRLCLEGFRLDDVQWAGLRIPVSMAFLTDSTPLGRAAAFYPSPAGPTESSLELDTWEELVRANPVLQEMAPDVEALLVNRTRGAGADYFLVPIDDCYRLVALMRSHWRGLSGGPVVWSEIGRFFARLREQSQPVKAAVAEAGALNGTVRG